MSAFELPGARLLLTASLICFSGPGSLFAQSSVADDSVSPGKAAAKEAHEPMAGPTVVQDLVLDHRNTIQIRVVDEAGQPVSNLPVTLLHSDRAVAQAATNPQGEASFTRVRPGMHVLHTGDRAVAVRFWSEQAAPPNAVRQPAIVLPQQIVRGQYGPPMMAGPAILLTGVAAVAIVLAGKNSSNNHHRPASP